MVFSFVFLDVNLFAHINICVAKKLTFIVDMYECGVVWSGYNLSIDIKISLAGTQFSL